MLKTVHKQSMMLFIINDPKIDAEKLSAPSMTEITGLREMRDKLESCKSALDTFYVDENKSRKFESATNLMEPSYEIKRRLRALNTQFPTNAYAKMLEMAVGFKLLDYAQNGTLKHFDNASAPGAFVLAMNYWTTMNGLVFDWKASTYLASGDNTALSDKYGIMNMNMSNYTTTNTTFNGDTTDVKYLRYIQSTIGSSIDLYTSDLGVEINAGQYHIQEAMNAKPNLGQVLFGLLVLRQGGAFITKQYYHFSTFTMSLVLLVAMCFDEVFLHKPMTSKPDNSEVYIVGLGYRGAPQWIIDIMFSKLEQQWISDDLEMNFTLPLVSMDDVPEKSKQQLCDVLKTLTDRQCTKLRANIAEYKANEHTVNKGRPSKKFLANHSDRYVKEYFDMANFRTQDKKTYIKTRIP
jgi:hypothetical protein